MPYEITYLETEGGVYTKYYGIVPNWIETSPSGILNKVL